MWKPPLKGCDRHHLDEETLGSIVVTQVPVLRVIFPYLVQLNRSRIIGGNTLKNMVDVPEGMAVDDVFVRLSNAHFDQVLAIVVSELIEFRSFTGCIETIPFHGAKETFGDLDLLVEYDGSIDEIDAELSQFVQDRYGASVVYRQKNDSMFNFDFPLQGGHRFQVDLILAPSQEYLFTKGYFSYNDLGNLIGVIARNMELKFGHKGLFMPVGKGPRSSKAVLVTQDFDMALQFFGLDPEKHRQGFNNLEELFRYVASSPYFSPDLYLVGQSSKYRARARKRPTHQAFISWCEQNGDVLRQRNCLSPMPEKAALALVREFFPLLAL